MAGMPSISFKNLRLYLSLFYLSFHVETHVHLGLLLLHSTSTGRGFVRTYKHIKVLLFLIIICG